MTGVLRVKVDGVWIDYRPMQEVWPAGSIRSSIAAVADPGWLLFGQTVANAQSLYPALWLVVPAGWKSGSSLVIPSDVDCGLRGSSTAGLGQVSGTNTKALAVGNLPVHDHGVGTLVTGNVSSDHAHGFTTGNPSANHVHAGVDHLHGVNLWSGDQDRNHVHYYRVIEAQGGASFGFGAVQDPNSVGGEFGAYWSSGVNQGHLHATNGSSDPADRGLTTGTVSEWHTHSGTTGGIDRNHNHPITGTTGQAGSGTALNVQDAAINVRFQIKAH